MLFKEQYLLNFPDQREVLSDSKTLLSLGLHSLLPLQLPYELSSISRLSSVSLSTCSSLTGGHDMRPGKNMGWHQVSALSLLSECHSGNCFHSLQMVMGKQHRTHRAKLSPGSFSLGREMPEPKLQARTDFLGLCFSSTSHSSEEGGQR